MATDESGAPRFIREYVSENIASSQQTPQGDEFWSDHFTLPGTNNFVSAIAVSGSDLYIAGWFTKVGSVDANYVARWDGPNWFPLGSGMSNYVYAVAFLVENSMWWQLRNRWRQCRYVARCLTVGG